MANRFEIDFLNELDGQLVSLARRASQKDDREDRTSLRRVLLIAGAVAGLAALAALLALTLSHTPKATGTAVVASQVPAVIPAQGVTVADTVVLKPPPAHLTPAISRDRAVSIMGVKTPPSVTVLASVTVPATVPTQRDLRATAGYSWAPIENRTAWVLVYPFAHPTDVRIGGPARLPGAPSASPMLMSQQVNIVDAQTGKFIFGFYLP